MFYLKVIPWVSVPHPLVYTSTQPMAEGHWVKIHVKQRPTYGLVCECTDQCPRTDFQFAPIEGVVYNFPILYRDGIQVLEWLVRYYASSPYVALETALPASIRQGKAFPEPPALHATDALPTFSARATRLAQAYQWIAEHPYASQSDFLQAFPQKTALLRSLLQKQWVQRCEFPLPEVSAPSIQLNQEQQPVFEALTEALLQRRHATHVLWGVTGSGKTEIYHALIAQAKKAGLQTLYLVPEITLSEQALAKFQQRLSAHRIRVGVWHSQWTATEKMHRWHQALRGEFDVILGTRSAVFVPLPKLGLVIVDEEHEPSYKQSDNPRYHGRDLAIYRAAQTQSLCLLGSATPSVETWTHVKSGKYQLHTLSHRSNHQALPKIFLADMRYEKPSFEGTYILSQLLREKINERLDRHEQTLLFLNRRGYAPYLYCPQCQRRVECPHCQSNLVFHQTDRTLRCHICDAKWPAYDRCPHCQTPLKLSTGLGTQRIEAFLQRLYKNVRILRLDSDVLPQHPQWYEDICQQRYDIIIGTQLLAKGLDFPKVTLVGMIQADGPFSPEDFRSAERLFQLIVQVSGRSGRTLPGEVVLQTFTPEEDCIRCGMRGDVETFLERESALRQKYRYPPFRRMIRHIFRSRSEKTLVYVVQQWAQFLRQHLAFPCEVLGPATPTLGKINHAYRRHMLYLVPSILHQLPQLQHLRQQFKIPTNVIDLWDVDPLDFR